MVEAITRCRICGNANLRLLISLGEHSLSGIFPRTKFEPCTTGPLELVKCDEKNTADACGLVQLRHSYSLAEMYGNNYGYRSGLNSDMVAHLQDIVKKALTWVDLKQGDLIIDVGSNDGTLLKAYPQHQFTLLGVDPTVTKFQQYYPPGIRVICDFFDASLVRKEYGNKRAKIITSIAMFYDLEDPLAFVRQVHAVLDDDGVWVFEQSYMPLMVERHAYDSICHEHLEYYGMKQIKRLLDGVGLMIVDVELNDVNGGSFKITAAKKHARKKECSLEIERLLAREESFHARNPFESFIESVGNHRLKLRALLEDLRKKGKKVLGYGASTKGNVILQYCGLSEDHLSHIAEVNEEKFGAFTPRMGIPIIPEAQAKAMHPDYFLVFPWAFKRNFLMKERETLASGAQFIFPLPQIEIVGMHEGVLTSKYL